MDEMPSPMPQTPWWSTPGATAVLPQEPAPSYAPPPPVEPPAPPKQRKRPGTAALLALALVVGGGTGGAVAEALHDDPVATVSSSNGTTLSGTRVVGSPSTTVSGTPESAAAVIGPKVVTIEVTGTSSSGFGGQQTSSGTGSGVVYRVTGGETFIVTNNHVVEIAAGSGDVHVTLANGDTVAATVVGTDPTTDLAVIKIASIKDLDAAELADSEALKVGQAVLAVGAPLGLSNTVTQGIVSTLHRPVATGENVDSQSVIDAIQTDAAINPGNSGGALVDLAGRLVGINSAIATDGSGNGNIGVGFSIPSAQVAKIADQLIATGKAVHSQIGVSVGNAQSTTNGAPGLGAAISAVSSTGPAAKAGLLPGDVVTQVDDRRVTDANSLIVAIRSHDPGETVTLTLTRGGATRTLQVTLASAGG